ncbi:MAG: serine hydrolase domain-containing protein [Inquilinaceae bacterium]
MSRPGVAYDRLHRRTVLAGLAGIAIPALLPVRAGAVAARPSGLDPALLDRAARRAAGLDQLHGLIVARGGEILLGEAFRGPALDRAVNVKSVSKTIVAALTGAALDRGVLDNVDQPIVPFLSDLVPAAASPRVGEITVAHLLTMQAGLERTSGVNYGRWVQSPDWVAFALGRPFVADPGAGMLYSTGSYHLLGAVLSRAAGESLLTLAREWLGVPLGIDIPPWTRDPQGFYMGGNEMALSPLALFRFGEMVRLGGQWDGAQVLSAAWIDASWTRRTRSPFSGDDYGYGWFLRRVGGHDLAYARGYGGQMLYVVPALGLTVVVTSDPTRPARSGGYVGDLHALLAEDIIPAAERA